MEQNPLEQEKISKINAARKELRESAERFFSNKEEFKKRMEDFILQLDILEENYPSFDKKEETIKGLKESLSIENKENFISHLEKIFEPILILRINQPSIFEKMARERTLRNGELKLSEVLYMSMDKKEVQIHLAPAKELIKEAGIGNFKKEIENGLIKLAEIIKSDKNIEKITATSWIVAKNPLLLEKLGFTLGGNIPEEEREEHFTEEKRPIAKAFITRKDFLNKYSKK